MPQTVWIARHGNRIDFVNPQWFDTAERPYDPHLSDDGIIQAKLLGKRLVGKGITQIFASPFLRTVQTANAVAETLDLSIKLDWGLCEWLNPDWMDAMPETLPWKILAQNYPRIDLSYQACSSFRLTNAENPSYPETWEACLARTRETVRGLVAEYPDENILFVGHAASVIGTAMGLVANISENDINASLCCLVKIIRQDGEWLMELNGDTSHLEDTEAFIRFN